MDTVIGDSGNPPLADPALPGIVKRLRKASVAVYLAAEEGPADDLSDMLRLAADAIDSKARALAEKDAYIANMKRECNSLIESAHDSEAERLIAEQQHTIALREARAETWAPVLAYLKKALGTLAYPSMNSSYMRGEASGLQHAINAINAEIERATASREDRTP
jgi:hypothetical protein